MDDHQALVGTLRRQLARETAGPLLPVLAGLPPEEISFALRGLDDDEVEQTLELLRHEAPELFGEVLSLLDPHDVYRVLSQLPDDVVAHVLEDVPPDDATWMVELLEAGRVDAVVDAMEATESREVRERLEYPESSAGRLMSDEFISLSPEADAGEAIARLREAGEEVTVIYVYLTDPAGVLTGVVSLRRLIRVAPTRQLAGLSPDDVVRVSVYDDQEEVVGVFQRYDLVCVPVVDERGRLVGVITHDDVLDVQRDEATEDILAMAGTSPEDALTDSAWQSARLRMPWLSFCLVGGIVSARLLKAGESRLEELFAALVVFAPLIVGMGGNVGMQSATLVVRGLATGQIQRHDTWRVFWAEIRTALIVGGCYGVVLALAAWLLIGEGPAFAFVIGAALTASMLIAALFGTLLPILFHALRVDPAVATGPLVTTVIDILGIGTYLLLAGWLLSR